MADNKLMSLTEIFNQKIFRIPDFQRGYSWEKNQLQDFWEDLQNLKDEQIHYTGLLTVEPVDKKEVQKLEKWQDDLWLFDKGVTAYYVIDGQQRLTTSIILINEVLKSFKENEGINLDYKSNWVNRFLFQSFGDSYMSFIFGYEKDNPSDEYFKTKILNQRTSTSDKVPEQTLYTSNLAYAKNYFAEKIASMEKPDLESIFKKVTNRFKFNFYVIDSELDVYVTFETMNNRGKPLSNLELLKNRLIYLSTLIHDKADLKIRLRKDINEVWKTVYEFLGKNKDNHMDDDEFLFNHWIMYYKYDRKMSESYAHFLLHQKFTAKSAIKGDIAFQDIKSYIDSLAVSVKSWFYLHNVQFSTYKDETKEWIQKLNRLGLGAFPPLFLAALTNERDEEKLIRLFQAAERFIFLVFRLSQRPSNTKNNHFYRIANQYYFQQVWWEDEVATIEAITAHITWLTDGYGDDEEEYMGWFDLDLFHQHITELFRKNEGYYSWSGLRYFLFEYELYLQNEARGNQKVKWEDFNKRKKEDTIEHIYPQTPKDPLWAIAFKGRDKKEKKIFLNTLGNLLLLSQSKNSELQNKNFNFKKRHKTSEGRETGYFNGSYSEIQVASLNDWTPEEITTRGIEMLHFMEKRWNISFELWENTPEALLSLNFETTEN